MAMRTSLARVPDGLLPALERRYELRPLEPGERLAGGYANDIFRLEAPSGPVVLRVQYTPLPERLRWEHDVVRRLAERLPEVPAPLAARDGTTFFEHDGYAAWLLPFVDGVPGRGEDERERVEAAGLLGRLHRAGLELAVEPWPGQRCLAELAWPDTRIEYGGDLAGRNAEVEGARAWAMTFVRETAGSRRLATSLVHGDYFPGNVLFRRRRAVAVLDWEELAVDWTTYDLASGLWSFCTDEANELDRTALADFVAAYRDAGGTAPPREDDLIVPFVRVKRLMEVLRAPTDRHVDWAYQAANLDAFRRLA
jgi:Ser/Thr protein kinase RdoA (MazF antagonist)